MAPYDADVEDLRIERDDAVLAASYSAGAGSAAGKAGGARPKTGSPGAPPGAGETALVALHGAGMGTRDYFLYEHLHAVLPPAGIGVVTFDRRGEGESTGDASRGRFDVQVGDALAVREAIDAERVGLWGVSQGGWIGPMAAAASERVAFLVLLAAAGVTPGEQMFYANEHQLRLAGYDDAVVERARELRRRFEAHVHGEPVDDEQLAADLLAALDEPWFGLLYLPPVLFEEESRRLWIEEMDFDPRPILQRVRLPTLLFFGEADSWTPVEPSVAAWREARGDDVEIVVVPEAEHELTLPDGNLAPEYEGTLVDWLVALRR